MAHSFKVKSCTEFSIPFKVTPTTRLKIELGDLCDTCTIGQNTFPDYLNKANKRYSLSRFMPSNGLMTYAVRRRVFNIDELVNPINALCMMNGYKQAL